MKYTADEARQLKAYEEIPDNGRRGGAASWLVDIEKTDMVDQNEDDNCAFDFNEI